MKNSSAWAFGIVFLAACIFFWWNGLEIPHILLGKTNTVDGIVIKNKHVLVKNGYMEFFRYAYKVDTTWYFGYKTIGKRNGHQSIGNSVVVEYVLKKPSKNKVLIRKGGHPHRYSSYASNGTRYIKGGEKGYSEIELNNYVMFKRKHALYGKVATEYIGKYWFAGDTLYFDPLGLIRNESLEEIEPLYNKRETFLRIKKDSSQRQELIDLQSNEVYKSVSAL